MKTKYRKGETYLMTTSSGREEYRIAGRWEDHIVLAATDTKNSLVLIYTEYEMEELQQQHRPGSLKHQRKPDPQFAHMIL